MMISALRVRTAASTLRKSPGKVAFWMALAGATYLAMRYGHELFSLMNLDPSGFSNIVDKRPTN